MKSKIVITALTICLISIALLSVEIYKRELEEKKILFMELYIPLLASESVLKWSKYYDLNWIDVFSLLMTESNGKRTAKSGKRCKGYLQMSEGTAEYTRNRLKEIIHDTNIYATEFNIASGCLFLKYLDKYYAKGDLRILFSMYNTGSYNYRVRKKRAKRHTRNCLINLTYYKSQWEKF